MLDSCPQQLPARRIKMHSWMTGGTLIPLPPIPTMHRSRHSPSGILARAEDLSSGPAIFMVLQLIFMLGSGSAALLQAPSSAMPRIRLRMRPRRGAPWHPRRSSSPPPGPSTSGSRSAALIVSPRPQAWRSPPDLHSSSPSPRSKPNTPSMPREHYVILQDLVFELRDGVNDLHFRVQQMEGRLSLLLQLLAPPPPAAPDLSSDTRENSTTPDISSATPENSSEQSHHRDSAAASPEPRTALVQAEPSAISAGAIDVAISATTAKEKDGDGCGSLSTPVHANDSNTATDMHWTAGGTPIAEEPGTHVPMPEYVPDYTVLAPYFSSSGSK